jgi:ATP-dependent RNA helicase RhlE
MFRKSFAKRHAAPKSSGNRLHGGGRGFSTTKTVRGKRKETKFDISLFVKKAIATTDTEPYNPKHRFEDFDIHEKLKKTIISRGYIHPTPIQDGAIPHVIKGRDLVGVANTGTGKTVAFLVPLISKAFGRRTERALIMTPTRELALQIEEEFKDFSRGSGLRSAICIGGAGFPNQLRALAARPNFVIGTPGRLKDLISRKALDLSTFNNVVLDEADRMLDMGFIKDIREILSLLSPKRQSLFFSATMPHAVAELTKKFLTDPVMIEIKSRATSENVEQNVLVVKNSDQKIEILHDLLLKEDFRKVLVFRRTKRATEQLSKMLITRGFRSEAIHGDKSQGQRERALRNFTLDRAQVLVATDVAARGLDIPDVTHVINYDLPEAYEDYIHRIGRTGRGTKTGNALTFVEEGRDM